MDILESELESLTGFDKEIREHSVPIWFESLVGVDWALLHLSPVWFGFAVPKGDGSPVVVVPGFLGQDVYLAELYLWLSRIGYTPYLSNIGWNADCLHTLSEKLIETIRRAHRETGKKVHLIGHSLGGVLSRSAAVQNSEIVESVITLASPFRGIRSHPNIVKMANKIRTRIFANTDKSEFPNCYTGHCHCKTVSVLQTVLPQKVKRTAIYTKTDGIVDWQNCRSVFEQNNYEVTGTHVGLVYNFQVYKIIAERLQKDLP